MLNGIDPIFLFNFFKLSPGIKSALSKIPLVDSIFDGVSLVPIPLYLSEKLTGLSVASESKHVDVQTDTETNKDGSKPKVTQKPIGSTVTIEMVASPSSIGLTILSAMMDVILPKLTSREYSITYLHGSVTVFNGQLQSFALNRNTDNNLSNVVVVLVKASSETIAPIAGASIPQVPNVTAALPSL